MADERWFTVQQVADLLQIHPQTVRDWLRTGRLRGAAFGGRTGWRISQSQLDEFLKREAEGNAAA